MCVCVCKCGRGKVRIHKLSNTYNGQWVSVAHLAFFRLDLSVLKTSSIAKSFKYLLLTLIYKFQN